MAAFPKATRAMRVDCCMLQGCRGPGVFFCASNVCRILARRGAAGLWWGVEFHRSRGFLLADIAGLFW